MEREQVIYGKGTSNLLLNSSASGMPYVYKLCQFRIPFHLEAVIFPFSRLWSYSAYEDLFLQVSTELMSCHDNFLLNLASEAALNSPAFSHEEGWFELKDVF